MVSVVKETAFSVGVAVHELAKTPVSALVFSESLLDYCKTNACGCYNKSWTCPPACGSFEEQQKKILLYKNVLVFTTKHNLEDSFDYDGMTKGRRLHSLLTCEIKKILGDTPVYSAGNCPICESKTGKTACSFPDPCPFPQLMIGSIEAAGIDVTELGKTCKIAYNNGENTVTFFSMLLS